jgi:hypothetical protein
MQNLRDAVEEYVQGYAGIIKWWVSQTGARTGSNCSQARNANCAARTEIGSDSAADDGSGEQEYIRQRGIGE